MKLAQFVPFLTEIAQVGEPLWTLASTGVIADEVSRQAMKRDAFLFEISAAAGKDDELLNQARTLRAFLKVAPVGVKLEEVPA